MSQAAHARGRSAARSMAVAALAATAATSLALGVVPPGASASVASSCPSASALKAAAGQSLTRIESLSEASTVICSYKNGAKAQVAVEVLAVKGIASSLYESYLDDAAKEYKAGKVQSLGGIGNAAIEYTQNDSKSNANGQPSTGVIVLASSKEIVVAGDFPSKAEVAIAKFLAG